MRYCLDTNVYIEAHRRYYAFDIAPGFWEALSRLAEEQMICSPMLVYDELTDSKDALSDWAKGNKEALFVLPDEETQEAYGEIADLVVKLYEPQHVQEFLGNADPWVIAHAKVHHLTVVTMEGWKSEQIQKTPGLIAGKIQIPNICKRVDVEYVNTFEFLRKAKIVLH
jgi:predicted nucleic acid-binding protein